jgi:Na+/proline symporter
MIIFLIAEVTAVSLLVKYLSGNDLWITSLIILSCSIIYTLYGGLRVSIFTDKIQFIFFALLLVFSFFYLFFTLPDHFNFNFIKQKKPELLSLNYINNFTAGLTFFIAVAATNLFHQGNWQRVYAAQNNKILTNSLILSLLIVTPIVFIMGFSGLVAISQNANVNADLAFFYLILQKQNLYISGMLIFLSISLAISSIDTIINAISSLIIVDAKRVISSKLNSIKLSNAIVLVLCLITFIVSSKGLSILYLFLLADLFCCSAVISIFYGFYRKDINTKQVIFSITIGLISGILFFPSPNFTESLLVGLILPAKYFPTFIRESLLFVSFLVATFLPVLVIKFKKIF